MRGAIFALFLVFATAMYPQSGPGEPAPLSLVELITNPKKYERKLVTVQGFVHIESEKPHGFVVAYLREDDAKDVLTSNSILIVPSKQMLQDREKINGQYVFLTGSFRTTPSANGGYIPELKDIQSCTVRPKPERTD
jgi:hypothetical protein